MSEGIPTPAPASVDSSPSSDTNSAANASEINNDVPTSFAEARKFRVKVDGQEMEVDEGELVSNYQLRKASDKKLNEAAQMRKQAEEFISLLRSDPIKVLNHPGLGVNFRELAENFLIEQLQEEMMDPRDKELKAYKKRVEEIEAREREEKQRIEAEQMRAVREKYQEDYSRQITEALAQSGLPKTQETVKRIAHYLHLGLTKGVDLQVSDVIPYVKQDYIKAQRELFGAADEDMLLQLLGEDVAAKLRKADVKRLKQPQAPTTPVKQGVKVDGESRAKKRITMDDWKAKLERIKNGEE